MFDVRSALIGALASAVVLLSIQGHTGDFSLIGAYGQGNYSRSGNNTWHQQDEGMEVQRNFRPATWQFGVGYKFTDSKWGAELTRFRGGTASMNAIAVGYPYDDASLHDPNIDTFRQECREKLTSDCTNRYRGQGGIEGFWLMATYDLFKVYGVTVQPGLGLSLYRAEWAAQVYPMDPSCLSDDNNCKWRVEVNQKTDWLLSPVAQLKLKADIYKSLSAFVQGAIQFRTGQHAPITPGFADSYKAFMFGLEYRI